MKNSPSSAAAAVYGHSSSPAVTLAEVPDDDGAVTVPAKAVLTASNGPKDGTFTIDMTLKKGENGSLFKPELARPSRTVGAAQGHATTGPAVVSRARYFSCLTDAPPPARELSQRPRREYRKTRRGGIRNRAG